jgi:ankyrin repeat protein
MRAIESASYPIVEYLLEKGVKVTQENIQGKTAFDLAKDYADPRVYFAVKIKFDALPKPKDKNAKKAKKKPEKKKKKDENVSLIIY